MTKERIQDPEGAKNIVVSFMTAAGAAAAVSRHHFKIVCFADPMSGMLKVDKDATLGGKQRGKLQSRRMILVYKTSMHPESHLTPTQRGARADPKTRHT
jgi:hypothetical protein